MWPGAAIALWIEDVSQCCDRPAPPASTPPSPPLPPPLLSSPPRTASSSGGNRKRRRHHAMGDGDGDGDANATPRPPKKIRPGVSSNTDAPIWPPHPLSLVPGDEPASPPASASSSRGGTDSNYSVDSATGEKRKRGGRSPSKRLKERQHHATLPVDQRTITSLKDLPDCMHHLWRTLRKLSKGIGVLHERHREWLPKLSRDCDEEEDESIFAGGTAGAVRDARGIVPSCDWAERLCRQADRNHTTGASEAAWNSEVHHPVLAEALHCSTHANSLLTANVTTARIHPASLLGSSSTSETASAQAGLKRVDFCVAMNLDRSTEDAIMQTGVQLNHTDYNPVRCSPIAISLETKAVEGNDPEAVLQLITWGCAQLTLLRQLRNAHGSTLSIPPLPMILVAGHSWTIYFLHMDDEQEATQRARACLWRGCELGGTHSPLGVYCIMACLQYLFEWVELQYRPWFERDLLMPLLTGRG